MPAILLSIALSLTVSISAYAQPPADTVLFKFADGQSLIVEKNNDLLTFQRCNGAGQCQSLGRAEGYTTEELAAAKKKLDRVGLAYGAGVNFPVSACAGLIGAGAGLALLASGVSVIGEINGIAGLFAVVIAYVGIGPVTLAAGLPAWAYGSETVHELIFAYDRFYRPSAILRTANPDGKTQFWQDMDESHLDRGENPNEFKVEGEADIILRRIEKVLNRIK